MTHPPNRLEQMALDLGPRGTPADPHRYSRHVRYWYDRKWPLNGWKAVILNEAFTGHCTEVTAPSEEAILEWCEQLAKECGDKRWFAD